MAKKGKLADFIDAALNGKSEMELSTAIDILKQNEPDAEGEQLLKSLEPKIEIKVEETKKVEEPVTEMVAHCVSYEEGTKRYLLHKIAFVPNGNMRYLGSEVYGQYLPEVHSKLSKLIIEPLIGTMYPGYKSNQRR